VIPTRLTTADTAGARAGRVAPVSEAAARERTIALLAALSWLAAVIHGAVAPEHWADHPTYAVCFALLAVLQGAWAVAFFRAPSASLLRLAALLSLAVIAGWAISRTTGLPVGPERGVREAVGTLDLAATAAEAVLAAAGLRLAGDWPAGRIPASLLPLGLAVLVAGGVALMTGGHAH